jgi:hypothetical protein
LPLSRPALPVPVPFPFFWLLDAGKGAQVEVNFLICYYLLIFYAEGFLVSSGRLESWEQIESMKQLLKY